jgi:cell division protein FtsI/penicillin-binding protein 2
VKNKNNNNNNNANSTSKFKITFLIAIFGMILITSTLIWNTAAVVVFAQTDFEAAVKKQAIVQTQNILDNETALLAQNKSTNSLQSDNQTKIGQNPHSNS